MQNREIANLWPLVSALVNIVVSWLYDDPSLESKQVTI